MSALLLLVSYIAGILIADITSPALFAIMAISSLLLLLNVLCRRWLKLSTLLLCSLSLSLGILLYHLNRYPQDAANHLLAFADKDPVVIDGQILKISERTLTGYTIDLQRIRVIKEPEELSLQGRIRLYVENGEGLWVPGDMIRFKSKLKRPRPFGTPGEFDLGRQLALENIFVTAYVPESVEILLLRGALPEERGNIEKGRTLTARFISAKIPSEYGPLVKALAIGDKSGLSPDLRDRLARSGLSHLFAISGLHLALIALALYVLGLTLYRRSTFLLLTAPPARILPLLIAPLLILYLLWTGNGISTQRAVIMVLSGTLLFSLRRKSDHLDILWFAALVILLCQPLLLFFPSFQLSFVALYGIIMGSKKWQPYINEKPASIRYPAALFLSSLCATIATLPLVLYHFHLIAPGGLINNLFAIPLIGWIGVPLALGGSLLWPFAPDLAGMLLTGCESVLKITLYFAGKILLLPGVAGTYFYPSLSIIAILSLFSAAFFLPSSKKIPRILLVSLAILLLFWGLLPEKEFSVTALSVGQGDATLISLGDHHFLVDGGGLYSDRIDVGRQVVAPALGRLGVHRLEAVILTHFHPDHAKGLVSILDDLPCRRLIINAPLGSDNPLLPIIHNKRIPVEVAAEGWQRLFEKETLKIFMYQPPESGSKDENDRSLAIYAREGSQGVLLPGDLGEEGTKSLMTNLPPGPTTLFKLPHHGSERSVPAPLITLLDPRLTFVSVGYQNRFNFPHFSVLDFLRREEIPLWRTDLDGSLRFTATADLWQVKKL